MTTSQRRYARRSLRIGAVACAGLLAGNALAACSASGSTASSGRAQLRLLQDPQTLDPVQAGDIISRGLADFAYDTLVAVRDGKIVPQVAESWSVKPDSVRLKIRKGVTCSDGSSLAMKDVADSIKRLKEPTASDRSTILGPGNTVKVSSDEQERTVDIKLAKPFGGLLYGLSRVYVICRPGLDDPKKLTKKTYGTGPYYLQSSTPGSTYAYSRHKGYDWSPTPLPGGAKAPTGIDFKVIPSESTATNSFLTGDLDITSAQGQDKARLESSGKVTEKKSAQVDTITMYMNHIGDRPTADADVRKAIFAGLDRASVATALYGKGTKVARTGQREGGLCYAPDRTGPAMPAFDVKAAKRHLIDAGYTMNGGKMVGPGGKPLTLKIIIPELFGPRIADVFIQQLAAIGVEAKPTVTQHSGEILEKGDWDLYLAGFVAISPTEMLSWSQKPDPAGENMSGIHNKKFNSIAANVRGDEPQEVCGDWAKAESALYENADIIPIARVDANFFSKDMTFDINLLSSVRPDGLGWRGSSK